MSIHLLPVSYHNYDLNVLAIALAAYDRCWRHANAVRYISLWVAQINTTRQPCIIRERHRPRVARWHSSVSNAAMANANVSTEITYTLEMDLRYVKYIIMLTASIIMNIFFKEVYQ